MMKHNLSTRARILMPLFVGFLAIAAAFVLISYQTFKNTTISDCVDYAHGLNRLIADSLDVDQINDYLEQGRSHPDYNRIEEHLYKLRDAYPDIIFLYVYQVREDGCHVVFDLDTENVPASKPGEIEEFDPSFKAYIPDLLAGKEIPPVISSDLYGYLLTIYTPLYDSQGVCQCYVAVDYSMMLLTDYVMKIIQQILLLFLVVVFVAVAVSALLTDRGIIKPMKQLETRAYRDTLTGLKNRTAYAEHSAVLDQQIASKIADFSIMMMDVNYLKRVNDSYGHEKGNEYLKGAVELAGQCFGRERLYRTGGDEFVAVFEGTEQDKAQSMIQSFRQKMAELQAREDLSPWQRVSAAVGIAAYESHRDTCAADVLKRADATMYQDKLAMKAQRRD